MTETENLVNKETSCPDEDRSVLFTGVTALVFFSLLAVYHLHSGKPYHILWTCHVACLLTGSGLILKRPMMNAIGFLWLCFGVPLWLINVFSGDELIWLSVPTHIGGLLIGFAGVNKLGIPRYTWLSSSILLILLGIVSRFITPPEANVNLSHAIWTGYEKYYPSYFVYVSSVYSSGIVTFFIVELLTIRLLHFRDKKRMGLTSCNEFN